MIVDSLLSLPDAARRLSVSVRSLYRLIASGQLPQPVKVGNCSRLYESDLTAYLEGLKKQRA